MDYMDSMFRWIPKWRTINLSSFNLRKAVLIHPYVDGLYNPFIVNLGRFTILLYLLLVPGPVARAMLFLGRTSCVPAAAIACRKSPCESGECHQSRGSPCHLPPHEPKRDKTMSIDVQSWKICCTNVDDVPGSVESLYIVYSYKCVSYRPQFSQMDSVKGQTSIHSGKSWYTVRGQPHNGYQNMFRTFNSWYVSSCLIMSACWMVHWNEPHLFQANQCSRESPDPSNSWLRGYPVADRWQATLWTNIENLKIGY